MKILFISDIHANYEALLALEGYIQSADMSICLGDIVGYHCHVNEVIDFLKSYRVKCIQGNHDRYMIESLASQIKEINASVKFGIDIAQQKITAENLSWLKELPVSLGIKEDNISILCCHGSPWDPINGYIYEDSLLFPKMEELCYDIIALGHTHRQYIKICGKQIVFNPGSVGQARDREGVVCAKILDTRLKHFEDLYLEYDFQKEIHYSKSYGAESWIYKHFQTKLS